WNRALGTAAERCALPAAQAVKLPEGVSFEEGATFGIPLQTACAALLPFEELPGRWVLVQGGTGAVGRFAVQIAKRFGARVIATAGSAEKAAQSLAAGADHAIRYRDQEVAARVRELTGGAGVDRIVEVEFGRNAAQDLAALRPHGTLAVFGSQDVPEARLEVRRWMWANLRLRFLLVYELEPGERAAVLAAIERFAPTLQIDLAQVLPLEEIARAHEIQESGSAVGNLMLRIG